MAQKKRITFTPEQISQAGVEPFAPEISTPIANTELNRENQISVKGEDLPNHTLGLSDINEVLHYYFENVIRPTVLEKGSPISVPVLYATPERWSSMQRDGAIRDKNGKMQTPVIVYKRTSVEKNRGMGNKVNANSPRNFQIFKKQFSKRNTYTDFVRLQNRIPEQEYYMVAIPDYVNISYSCTIITSFVEQGDKLVEALNYASDTYWGDPERFSFRAMIDSYSSDVVLIDEERVSKIDFNIQLMGYIIPDSIQAQMKSFKKVYSKSRISFTADISPKTAYQTQEDPHTDFGGVGDWKVGQDFTIY